MGWEARGNNLYYYRKKRKAGKVVSEYVGRGAMAREIASIDLAVRKERQDRILFVKQHEEEFNPFEEQVSRLSVLVKQMVDGVLIISGFHKHKGQWRRQRGVN